MLNLGANITNCAKYLVKGVDFFNGIYFLGVIIVIRCYAHLKLIGNSKFFTNKFHLYFKSKKWFIMSFPFS